MNPKTILKKNRIITILTIILLFAVILLYYLNNIVQTDQNNSKMEVSVVEIVPYKETTSIAGKELQKSYALATINGQRYINSKNIIKLMLKGTDENYSKSLLKANNIVVKVGGKTVTPETKVLGAPQNITNGVQYELTLSGIEENGLLTLEIDAGTLEDKASNKNILTTFDSQIIVDNIGPTIEANNAKYGSELSAKLTDNVSKVVSWNITTQNEEPLSGWQDIEAAYETTISKSNLTVSTYYVWAKDSVGNISSKAVNVEALEANNLNVTLNPTSYVYDGTEKEPEVIVKNGENLLQDGEDYTYTYEDNINAGKGKVIVQGLGNYTGQNTVNFDITKQMINIPTGKTLVYNGSVQTGVDDNNLYTADMENEGIDATTYTTTITLKDKDNYSWSDGTSEDKQIEWKIEPKNLEGNVTIKDIEDQTYTGNEIKVKPVITDDQRKEVLIEDTDYTLSYTNNVETGAATINISGQWNYTGTVYANFNITDSIAPTISVDSNENYQKSQTATVTLEDNSGLTAGTYKVKYIWSTEEVTEDVWAGVTDTASIIVQDNGTKKATTTITNNTQTGKYKLYIYLISDIKDTSNNTLKSGQTINGTFYLDNVVPTVNIEPNSQSTYLKGGIDIKISANDDGSGLSNDMLIEYGWSQSNENEPEEYKTITDVQMQEGEGLTATIPKEESSVLSGTYYLWIKEGTIQDKAENKNLAIVSDAFLFDNKAPNKAPGLTLKATMQSQTTLATANASETSTEHEFYVNSGNSRFLVVTPGADEHSGVSGVAYSTSIDGEKTDLSPNYINRSFTENTTYYFFTKDKVGIYSDIYTKVTFKIITNKPEIVVGNNTTWSKSVTTGVTIKDQNYGLAVGTYKFKYALATSEPSDWSKVTAEFSITISSSSAKSGTYVLSGLGNNALTGIYNLYVYSTTAIKNTNGGTTPAGTKASGVFYLDNTNPTYTIESKKPISVNISTLSIKFNDKHSQMAGYKIIADTTSTTAPSTWSTCTNDQVINYYMSVNQTYRIWMKDNAGNTTYSDYKNTDKAIAKSTNGTTTKYFYKLQDAISFQRQKDLVTYHPNVSDYVAYDDITLLADTVEKLNVTSIQKISINLQTYSVKYNASGYILTNTGDVTIKGKGSAERAMLQSAYSSTNIINNANKLNLVYINISTMAGGVYNSGTAKLTDCSIDAFHYGIKNTNGTITTNHTSIEIISSGDAIYASAGTVNLISGSTVSGGPGDITAIRCTGSSILNVNTTTVTSKYAGEYSDHDAVISHSGTGTINLQGGSSVTNNNVAFAVHVSNQASITIESGANIYAKKGHAVGSRSSKNPSIVMNGGFIKGEASGTCGILLEAQKDISTNRSYAKIYGGTIIATDAAIGISDGGTGYATIWVGNSTNSISSTSPTLVSRTKYAISGNISNKVLVYYSNGQIYGKKYSESDYTLANQLGTLLSIDKCYSKVVPRSSGYVKSVANQSYNGTSGLFRTYWSSTK